MPLNTMINIAKDLAGQISPILGIMYLQIKIDPNLINIVLMLFISFVVGFFSIRKSIIETRKIKAEHELIKKQIANENRQK